jgi:hypothetical protein
VRFRLVAYYEDLGEVGGHASERERQLFVVAARRHRARCAQSAVNTHTPREVAILTVRRGGVPSVRAKVGLPRSHAAMRVGGVPDREDSSQDGHLLLTGIGDAMLHPPVVPRLCSYRLGGDSGESKDTRSSAATRRLAFAKFSDRHLAFH